MTLIGRYVDEVVDMLGREGYVVDIVDNTSDKCTSSDATLVTNAVFDGKHCKLTVSRFLLEVKD